MVHYGTAMSAGGTGTMLASIGTLVSGTIGKLGELFGGVPPMDSLIAFSKVTVDKEAVKNNSEAMVEYAKAMTIGAGAKGMEAIGSLANFATNVFDGLSSIVQGEGVFDSQMSALKTMTKDADEIDPRKVKRVSKAMAWYASSMLTSAPASLLGAVGSLGNLVSNIADGIGSLFGGDSTLDNQLSAMKTMTTESDSIDPEKIKNVAVAMKEYGKAMASGMKASGAGALGDIANFVGGIVKSLGSFFGIAEADPIGDLKKFAKVSITADEVTQIQANATGLEAYATVVVLIIAIAVAYASNPVAFACICVTSSAVIETLANFFKSPIGSASAIPKKLPRLLTIPPTKFAISPSAPAPDAFIPDAIALPYSFIATATFFIFSGSILSDSVVIVFIALN
jgi:hypothetical protein